MDWMYSARAYLLREVLAAGAVVCALALGATAEDSATKTGSAIGNVEFDCPDAPKTTCEIDLSQGLFNDMFGIGNAAISGVVETLAQAAEGKSEETQAAAEQMEAARQIVELSGKLIQGVRVRVYEESDKSSSFEKLTAYYEKKLKGQNWETIARVHDGEDMVVVSALRRDGAFKGLFVIGSDGENLVLTNVVCDVSPENVKKLTSAATKSGLQAGLGEMLESGVKKVHLPSVSVQRVD